jgi:hypothetical protein
MDADSIGETLASDRTFERIEALNCDFSNWDANAERDRLDAIANDEPLSFAGECNFGNPETVKVLCRELRPT